MSKLILLNDEKLQSKPPHSHNAKNTLGWGRKVSLDERLKPVFADFDELLTGGAV